RAGRPPTRRAGPPPRPPPPTAASSTRGPPRAPSRNLTAAPGSEAAVGLGVLHGEAGGGVAGGLDGRSGTSGMFLTTTSWSQNGMGGARGPSGAEAVED